MLDHFSVKLLKPFRIVFSSELTDLHDPWVHRLHHSLFDLSDVISLLVLVTGEAACLLEFSQWRGRWDGVFVDLDF